MVISRDDRRSKTLHARTAHAFLVTNGQLDDVIKRVIDEVTLRVNLYKAEKAAKAAGSAIKVNYRRFVSRESLADFCRTSIWTVNIAFESLDPEIFQIYSKGLAIITMARKKLKEVGTREKECKPISDKPSCHYRDYEREKCWAVMSYIRKRIKVGRPILSCGDLSRQFDMHHEAVRGLIHDRLSEEEFRHWKILVHRSKRLPISRTSPTLRPKKSGVSEPLSGRFETRHSHLKARGWEKYPAKLLKELLTFVQKEMDDVESGNGVITSYYVLREKFGVSVGVIGDYLLHELGPMQFDRRNRLAKIRRPSRGEEKDPAAGA